LVSGIERTFTFLSIQFGAALRIRLRPANELEIRFRGFHARASEVGAFPNKTICLTVFLLSVCRRGVTRNPR
jgi:hypothetical protein